MYEKAGEYVMAPTRRIRLENNVLIISINVAPGRKGEGWDLTYIISIYLHIVLFYLLWVCLLQLKSKQNRLKPLLDSLWVILVVCCNFLWLRCTQLKQINTTQETQQSTHKQKVIDLDHVKDNTSNWSTLRLKSVAGACF